MHRRLSVPNFRLLKAQRLLCPAQYQAAIRAGHRSIDFLFVVYARANGLKNARVGITVSRRVSQKAINRNRIKRTIRESFRHNNIRLAGLDVVAIARPTAETTNNTQLANSLQQHWKRVDHE